MDIRIVLTGLKHLTQDRPSWRRIIAPSARLYEAIM